MLPRDPRVGERDVRPLVAPDATGGLLYLPGSPAFYAYSNQNQTWEMLDNLTWTHGRHSFKFGAEAIGWFVNRYMPNNSGSPIFGS